MQRDWWFLAIYHRCYNNGDGTFSEVGRGTETPTKTGAWILFVANDTVQNFLFVNRGPDSTGKTKWEEPALASEVGFIESGQARSGMGVDAADFDNDAEQDLFVANVDQEISAGTIRARASLMWQTS